MEISGNNSFVNCQIAEIVNGDLVLNNGVSEQDLANFWEAVEGLRVQYQVEDKELKSILSELKNAIGDKTKTETVLQKLRNYYQRLKSFCEAGSQLREFGKDAAEFLRVFGSILAAGNLI